jgi:hypothetical protein
MLTACITDISTYTRIVDVNITRVENLAINLKPSALVVIIDGSLRKQHAS